MDGRSSPVLVTFDPGVSPPRSNIEKSITSSTLGATNLPDRRSPCEKHAAACSVTASVVNVCGDGDRHVGIYASPDNWHTCLFVDVFVGVFDKTITSEQVNVG